MAQSILELTFKTSKQGTGGKAAAAELKELKGTVGEVSQGLLGFNAGSLTAVGAVIAIGGAVNKAVTQYQDYAEAIRGMAAITGTGTEETSRLVQAMDDLGISQELVQTAMQGAAKKGFVMTTENVAKLADQYNLLNDQEDKNKLLTDTLGKSGLQLAKAFQAGGDAIREAAAAQGDGMIITAENAREAEALRVAQDNLNDSVMAFSNSVAKIAVPILTDLINSTMHATLTTQNMATELEKIPPQQRAGAIAAMEYRDAQAEANQAGMELLTLVGPMTEGIAGYSGALENQAVPATADLKQAQTDLNNSMKEYTTQLQFQLASEGLSADQKMKLAMAMGLIEEKSRYAIVKTQEWKDKLDAGKMSIDEYNRLVAGLANSLQRISSKDVTVTTHLVTITETRSTNRRYGGEAYANGVTDFTVPAGYPNDSYMVGLTSGERLTVTNDRMRATGSGDGGGGGSGQVQIGPIYVGNEMDYQTFLARLKYDLPGMLG